MTFEFSQDDQVRGYVINAQHGEIRARGKSFARAQANLIKKARELNPQANDLALTHMVIYETEKTFFVMTGKLVTVSPE